jgi:hypothetical protein
VSLRETEREREREMREFITGVNLLDYGGLRNPTRAAIFKPGPKQAGGVTPSQSEAWR